MPWLDPNAAEARVYEVDFLPVESENGPGSKSGDAITLRFNVPDRSDPVVVVIDAGFQATGDAVVSHIKQHYDTDVVDLMISTHPDADHINGLSVILEQLQVGELLLHQPRLHASSNVKDFSGIEAIDELISSAADRDVPVTEPFTGISRFGGALQVLGPTESYYEELVASHLAEVASGVAAARMAPQTGLVAKARDLLTRFVDQLPIETLTDDIGTSPRNDSSVITLVHVDGRRLLLTGDAGIPALTAAAESYETTVGSFADYPLNFFQAPHHGSRRNLGPTILNRILGEPSQPHGKLTSFISSAKADPKHPSPRVVNALIRRGCKVNASEGANICSYHGVPARPGYVPLTPLSPLAEDEDD